MTTGTRKRK
jgi:hypothetical protein